MIGRAARASLRSIARQFGSQSAASQGSTKSHRAGATLGALFGSAAVLAASQTEKAEANDDQLHFTPFPWSHNGIMSAYDVNSVRRGFQVYREVCASCHGLTRIAYRNLVGVALTEAEAKELAADTDYEDGPDDEGNMFERPGKLSDYLQSPYPNEKAARAANNGAYPPDLSLITKARHGGADYVFSLLTGYHDAPEGVTVGDGQYYNPYFPGGAIGMPVPLQDGQVSYDDEETPATVSQMAKDVVTFLSWCAEPEQDERKKQGVKLLSVLALAIAGAGYYKRFRWSVIKGRKVTFHKSA